MYTVTLDPRDARPRQPDEPGDHELSLVVRPEDGSAEVEIRWYADGGYALFDRQGTPILPIGVEHDEDGNLSYIMDQPT